jgi:hypothetical protein
MIIKIFFFLTNLLKNNMRTNLLINQLKPQINDTSFCSKASSCLLFIYVIKFRQLDKLRTFMLSCYT